MARMRTVVLNSVRLGGSLFSMYTVSRACRSVPTVMNTVSVLPDRLGWKEIPSPEADHRHIADLQLCGVTVPPDVGLSQTSSSKGSGTLRSSSTMRFLKPNSYAEMQYSICTALDGLLKQDGYGKGRMPTQIINPVLVRDSLSNQLSNLALTWMESVE
jgi:hypothetical protein